MGLDLVSASHGKAADSTIVNCTDASIHTSVLEPSAVNSERLNTQFNNFENLTLSASPAGNCYRADGSQTADSSNNIWSNIRCLHENGRFQINNADNNLYIHLAFEKSVIGNGISLHLSCAEYPSCADSATSGQSARNEVFFDISGNNGTTIVQDGKADGNVIYGLKPDNGMAVPIVKTGKLGWQGPVLAGLKGNSAVSESSSIARALGITEIAGGSNRRPVHSNAQLIRSTTAPSADAPNYFSNKTVSVTQDYKIPPTYENTYVMASGNIDVTPYPPAQARAVSGQLVFPTITIKNLGRGSVLIRGTFDGHTNYVLSDQYEYVTSVSDGSSWQIVGNERAGLSPGSPNLTAPGPIGSNTPNTGAFTTLKTAAGRNGNPTWNAIKTSIQSDGEIDPLDIMQANRTLWNRAEYYLPWFTADPNFQQGILYFPTPVSDFLNVGGLTVQGRINSYQLPNPGAGTCTVTHNGAGGSRSPSYTFSFVDANSGYSLPSPACSDPTEYSAGQLNALHYNILTYHQPGGGYSNAIISRGNPLTQVLNSPNHIAIGALSEYTACGQTSCTFKDEDNLRTLALPCWYMRKVS